MAHRLTIGQIAQIVEADVLEVYKLVDEGHGDQALLVKIAERLPANPNPKCGWCGQEFPRKAKKVLQHKMQSDIVAVQESQTQNKSGVYWSDYVDRLSRVQCEVSAEWQAQVLLDAVFAYHLCGA